jgi:ribonuclease PH
LKKNPIVDSVAATSVGIVNGTPLLDLNYDEDSRAAVDMNIVMTGAGRFVELQATGERSAFDDEELASLIELGRTGVRDLLSVQAAALQRQ